jgi:hypothetical protein
MSNQLTDQKVATFLVERWRPVLEKCDEIPEDDWPKAARMMQAEPLCDLGQIETFCKVTLPAIRRRWSPPSLTPGELGSRKLDTQ